MNDESRPRRWWEWWQTLPGILTASAGIITAVAGLIVALHQAGFFERGSKTDSLVTSVKNEPISKSPESKKAEKPAVLGTSPSPAEKSPSDHVKQPNSVALPADTEIRARNGEIVYKILAAYVEPYSPGKLSLRFEVRLTNNGSYDANFWTSSFRLLVDGVLRAPVKGPNELVDSNSAKEGVINFIIPDNLVEVGLQMGAVGEGKPVIPITLKQ